MKILNDMVPGTISGVPTDDTGQVTTVASVLAPTASWTVVSVTCRRVGASVNVFFSMTYIGTAIATNVSGDIPNIQVGTIDAAWRPSGYGSLQIISGPSMAQAYVNSAGAFWLALIASNSSIPVNSAYSFVGTWLH